MYTIPVDIKRHVKRDFTPEDFTKYGVTPRHAVPENVLEEEGEREYLES